MNSKTNELFIRCCIGLKKMVMLFINKFVKFFQEFYIFFFCYGTITNYLVSLFPHVDATAVDDYWLVLFYRDFTTFSTLFKLNHCHSSFYSWSLGKQTSARLGNVPCGRALHHVRFAATGDRTLDARFKIPDAYHF